MVEIISLDQALALMLVSVLVVGLFVGARKGHARILRRIAWLERRGEQVPHKLRKWEGYFDLADGIFSGVLVVYGALGILAASFFLD